MKLSELQAAENNYIPIDEEESEEVNSESDSLSRIWAEIITGKSKQEVTVLLVSEKGAGKSYTALTLCLETAREIANIRGGSPEDYFPQDLSNVACINITDIVTTVSSMKPYCCYLYDDIGVGLNSRKWQSEENIIVNDIVEIARTGRNLSIFTVMDSSLVDKVIREITGWHCEISESRHSDGYNVLKVFKMKKQHRTGKMHRVYITRNGSRLVRVIAETPPAEIAEAYDKLRDSKTDELKRDRLEKFSGKKTEKTITDTERKRTERVTQFGQRVVELRDAGYTLGRISEFPEFQEAGLNRYAIGQIYGLAKKGKIEPET